jgi:hypothetical protein
VTVHGGPTFRQWQAWKLPPSYGRVARWFFQDMSEMTTVLVAHFQPWAEAFIQALAPVAEFIQAHPELLDQLTDPKETASS